MPESASVLQPGQYYHIYNRGNNRENIFVSDENYRYFLKLYAAHIEPVADTYAYCLLKNHFHVLVRIKADHNLTSLGETDLSGLPRTPNQSFSNLFNAYAKAFNKAYQRTGALFQRPFSRILVTSEVYFRRLVTYIHQNPQKHGFVADFREWPYSSYQAHLSDKASRLQCGAVLAWFDGHQNFIAAHQTAVDDQPIRALIRDDFE